MDKYNPVITQGVGDVSRHLNQMRADTLLENLRVQDTNLENALNELQKVRDFYASPEHILGSPATKHGEIAEHMQVGFGNADRLVVGDSPIYTIKINGADRFAPEDYLLNGMPVQSKFVQSNYSVDAITEHLKKYPDFLSKGGSYDIPKDYYEQIQEWLNMSPSELNNLPSSENGNIARTVVKKIRQFEQENNVNFNDVVHPSQVNYKDAQINAADKTVDAKEGQIHEADQIEREKYELQAKASLKEGLKAAGISATIDGVLSFGFSLAGKLHQGKKLNDFTKTDWEDILKSTGIGVVRGGATGGGIYALTNVAGMSAPLAASLVTATIGIVTEAINLGKGKISSDDFMYNIINLSTEAAISGVGAFIGQMAIPIPVVGAMIGSFISTTVLHLIKDNVFGGGYYNLLNKAEYELMISSSYKTLVDAIEISELRFEKSIRDFTAYMNAHQDLLAQSYNNQNRLQNLLESI